MIPFPIPALKDLTVLVTRPVSQSESLCHRIDALGGTAIAFPTIDIRPIAAVIPPHDYHWLIFVSANAVRHGLPQVKRTTGTRLAAIGKATAAALAAAELRVDAIPQSAATSETLLQHPALMQIAEQRVLIVKGAGGRELLYETLHARGAQVDTADVYERVPPIVGDTATQTLEEHWRSSGIDIVTLTSVETLDNLLALLTESGRALLRTAAFVAVSERVVAAARARGLLGPCVPARGADDDAIAGAIAAWHARAR